MNKEPNEETIEAMEQPDSYILVRDNLKFILDHITYTGNNGFVLVNCTPEDIRRSAGEALDLLDNSLQEVYVVDSIEELMEDLNTDGIETGRSSGCLSNESNQPKVTIDKINRLMEIARELIYEVKKRANAGSWWNDSSVYNLVRKYERELEILGPRKLMYGIGQDVGKDSYGMWHGPVPSEEEVLDIVGRDDNSVIVRFNSDGSDEVIWRWEFEQWQKEMM